MVKPQKTNNMKKKLSNYLDVCFGELKDILCGGGEGFDELATNALKQCLNTTCLLCQNCEDTLIQLNTPVKDDFSSLIVDGVLMDEEDKNHVMFTVTDNNDEIQTVELSDVSRKAILEVIAEIKTMVLN